MLKSLFINNPSIRFTVYLMHSDIKAKELDDLRQFIEDEGCKLEVIMLEKDFFSNAPILLHYTKEMYYRLLAFKYMPQNLDKVLYLDPDILVLNPVNEFYNIDMDDYLYAAAYHDMIHIREINKLRLNKYNIDKYYNSGVLLMNLKLQREVMKEHEIYEFVEKNGAFLIMPDQDILNALYSKRIRSLDEKLFNYDARFYSYYKLSSGGVCDMEFVIRNTVILHFCGKRKPWKKDYSGKFHSLYKHYEKLAFPDKI